MKDFQSLKSLNSENIQSKMTYDVAIIGAGMSGMTAGLLLAKAGLKVILLEAHLEPGGCAGYFNRKDFSFDVGATTFVSFQEKGIGHNLLSKLGLTAPPLKRIEKYTLCLPDRKVIIPFQTTDWISAWSNSFPELGENRHRFFTDLYRTAMDYWRIAGNFPTLPVTRPKDLLRCANAVPVSAYSSLKWFFSSFDSFIKKHQLNESTAFRGAVNMLLQDTTQNRLEEVPTPYAVLGLTLMPHGMDRPIGSAKSLWKYLLNAFIEFGGEFRKRHEVNEIKQNRGNYEISFRGKLEKIQCEKLISSIPVWNTYKIAPHLFRGKLDKYLPRREKIDGAFALYLGVKDIFDKSDCLHYQVLRKFDRKLNDGNNFLISISESDDTGYAPKNYRSVTFSTHTDPHEWDKMNDEDQLEKGKKISEEFLTAAEELFPGFRHSVSGKHFYPASPLTFRKFTRRYLGTTGSQPVSFFNSSLNAIPTNYGTKNFIQIGDTVFPGVGTVSCMLSGFNAYRDCVNHLLKM